MLQRSHRTITALRRAAGHDSASGSRTARVVSPPDLPKAWRQSGAPLRRCAMSRRRVAVAAGDGSGLGRIVGKATRLRQPIDRGDSDHASKVGRWATEAATRRKATPYRPQTPRNAGSKPALRGKSALSMWLGSRCRLWTRPIFAASKRHARQFCRALTVRI